VSFLRWGARYTNISLYSQYQTDRVGSRAKRFHLCLKDLDPWIWRPAGDGSTVGIEDRRRRFAHAAAVAHSPVASQVMAFYAFRAFVIAAPGLAVHCTQHAPLPLVLLLLLLLLLTLMMIMMMMMMMAVSCCYYKTHHNLKTAISVDQEKGMFIPELKMLCACQCNYPFPDNFHSFIFAPELSEIARHRRAHQRRFLIKSKRLHGVFLLAFSLRMRIKRNAFVSGRKMGRSASF